MTPERMRQVEELYHEARTRDASARAAFLDASCAGDDALRREVESLLDQPDDLATAPALPETGASFFFEDLTGRHLGKFRVVALLGDGGMARVYKGYQASVDRFVALKVLPRQYAQDPRFVERFKQEARIVARLHHPHILSVFDHGESDGYTFLAMPFVETGTLADLLARGSVSFAQTERIIGQICEALDYAHAQGIVHRDIKPGNILIDADGNVFVADFGIATILGNTHHLTQPGMLLASPRYCSPEQLVGGHIGAQSDLYSVGMVLFEMLTGTAPFNTDGSLASILKRADSTLLAPRIRNSGITPALEAVILKALAPAPHERFSSGKELAAALSAALRAIDGQETTAVPVGSAVPSPFAERTVVERPAPQDVVEPPASSPRRRRVVPAAWAAVGTLTIAGVLAATMWRQTEAPPPQEASSTAPAPPQPAASEAPVTTPRSGDIAGGAATSVAPPMASPGAANGSRGESASAATPASRDGRTPSSERVTAKQMYAAAENDNPGLRYRIIQQRGSSEADADPSTTFHSGDRVRFGFESNIDGYLYVVQAGSSGRWTVLFPNPDANGGRNAVRRSEEYLVPDNGWFAFDDTPGTEEVFVVLSKRALDTLPGFTAPVTRRESVDKSVVVGLQASIQSRDLVFEKDQSTAADGRTRQATYIVNRGELASQVAALIQLNHAK